MNNILQHCFGYPFHLANVARRRYLGGNPYLAHAQMFIHHDIIPYSSIEDIKQGKVNRQKAVKIVLNIAIMLLNLLRFVAIASFDRKEGLKVREYFVELFANQPNHSFFYVTLVLLFVCPTVSYIYIFLYSFYPTNYVGFHILFDVIKRRKFGFPKRYIPVIDHGMRLLTLLHYLAHLISPFATIIAPLVDYFTVYDWADMSGLDRGLLLFWSAILVVSLRTTITITFVILQHMFFLNYYFQISFFKPENKAKGRHQTAHTKHAAFLTFMTLIGTVEFDLYILIDYRTTDFLKAITADQIPFVGLVLFVNFYMMSELNAKSKLILLELDQLLHRSCGGASDNLWSCAGNAVAIEKVLDQRQLIASDMISINMGDIFNLVRLEITQTGFQVVNNLFLIINSNR
ncbi:hypothetical protein TYRP_023113 [Tyrophagus putrescentiae]|nr:hypothetical protein TYRP_023113 [Tyrophagus putrescentiae]